MKTIYIADDGRQFDNIDDCEKYETYSPKVRLSLESTICQLKNFSSSKNKTYYYAKIYGNIYNGYHNKIFYKSKTNLIKSIKSSIKQYSGYWDDDNVASEIYNIMLQNNILNVGVLSI